MLPLSARRCASAFAACLLSIAVPSAAVIAAPPTPPAQPTHGPGGSAYTHAHVVAREVRDGAQGWWLFTPADPVPASAPVIVFCHGWGAPNPRSYLAWIQHIVGRGNIVVYPNYQDSVYTPGSAILANAVAGIRGAFADLSAGKAGIRADLRHVAVVGHSVGGLLSAQLAALAGVDGLPRFRAVMPVEPAGGGGPLRIPTVDLQRIPATTLLLVVVGAGDHVVYETPGLHIYTAATRIPAVDKQVLELRSDYHGAPALIANHDTPGAMLDATSLRPHLSATAESRHAGTVDAMDWYGTWKLLDALTDAAFYGRERDVALGGGPAQVSMGHWSDGVPVKPMRVLR